MTDGRLGTFFYGKRIMITGDSGFKGTWLSFWLGQLGATVRGMSLAQPVSEPCLNKVLGTVTNSVDGHYVDVRNYERVYEQFHEFEPEIVFHLAAQPLVVSSYADPLETITTNVLGTANILEATRHIESVKVLVIVTSDKVYRNREWPYPYRETDELGGRDPYSASKACAELLTASYGQSFFGDRTLSVCTVRAGNVIGGGDWGTGRIVPDIVTALHEEKPLVLRNPESIRPWQHVFDPLYGYLTLACYAWSDVRFSGAWNFGPFVRKATTVRQLAMKMGACWGSNGRVEIREDATPLHEASVLKLDSSMAVARLNWRPVWDLNAAVSETTSWYKTYYHGTRDDVLKLSAYQLDKFCSDSQKVFREGLQE